MKFYFLILLSLLILTYSCDVPGHKTTIAFGSCSHEFDSAQMWSNVLSHNPKAWIWLGDNIYGDTEDMGVMKSKYDRQKLRPSYQEMIQSLDVYGIWDDHDYGVNDGGKEFPMKVESKALMLDFLDVPSDAPVHKHSGAYQSYLIEGEGIKIKLILLDTRYFRDTLEINTDAPPLYLPNEDGSILGDEQWSWLEAELTKSSADVHLIGSSYQLIPNDHGFEKWGNFPGERKRFFDLIVKTKPARPIILSGDRHIAEFSSIEPEDLEYPIYEFTSSGLTHTWPTKRSETNQYRIGELIIAKNFGILQIEKQRKSIDIKMMVLGQNNEVLQEILAKY
ncbi:MAG: alkaline phosphatase family protein [Cytophagales bacterium]|nr:alkaline phosphatase family protein [Cytophagales bacterium]